MPPGTIHAADAVAAGAQSDNLTAYNFLAGQPCNTILTGQDLGGLTLVPGVYCFSSSAQLTGALTLNAQGDPNAVFIFKMGSALTTASNSSVNIINGGSSCNVFWQVGSSAVLGTTTSFIGNILALASITLNTNATLAGRALAQNGAVTLDNNVISITQCNASFIASPTIIKKFGAAAIGVGTGTTLSFTITNPNASVALTGVAFTDTLPAGLVVSTPSNGLTGSCGGGTITAVAGSGSVTLSGATLAAGASCTFSVNVTGTVAGVKSNSVTVTSTNGGTGNTSTTSLTVLATPPAAAPPTINKTFGAAAIGVGGTTSLSFTITNPNAAVALTGVAFTDTLPAGLVVATANGLTTTCSSGTITAVAGSGTVTLSGLTLAAAASCTISVNVTGTSAGVKNNSVTVTSTNGGTGNTSTSSLTVEVVVIAPPTISKSFGAGSIQVGGTTALNFTIKNPNATVALTGVGFIDTLPAGLVVSTPNGLTGTCGGGTITAVAGSGGITLSGATLAAGASCTFSVNVTATISGVLTNTTGNVISSNGGVGNTAVAQLLVGADFEISYAANLQVGDSVINITNTGANSTVAFPIQNGNICVNAYAFSPDEQLIACCSCPVTPDGLVSLSARNDLISNTLTPGVPTSIVIKLLKSAGTCNASTVGADTNVLVNGGGVAWGTTIHALPLTPGSPATTYGVTERLFTQSTLSAAELLRITSLCGFIQTNGSGFGICRSCRLGGLGDVQRQ